jgi:vanillate O-demethylase monooxygenase subunit
MLKNAWYAAAFSPEIAERLLARRVLGEALVFYRTRAGDPVALADRCPHRSVPLSLGKLVDDTVRCTYHGIRIAADGACVRVPCQEVIPGRARVRSYPMAERHGFAWVWMGDPALADPARIPDVHFLDSPDWAACVGYHHIAADYRLMNDNLLDLSHESYLHDKTIGNEAVAEAPVSTQANDTEVRVHRDIRDCEPPPFYVKATGFTERINRWHTSIYQAPAYVLIENGSYPVSGTRQDALERRVIHLMTPETETSCHYFWGVARQYQRGDHALTEFIRAGSASTFDEDKDMLEAQQKALDEAGAPPFSVALATDAGPIQARRLLERLIRSEAEATGTETRAHA